MKRRDFAKTMAGAMAGIALGSQRGWAAVLAPGLSNPANQPKFANPVPDALAPGFIYRPSRRGRQYNVATAMTKQATGLIDPATGKTLKTWLFGYGDPGDGIFTWPGRTFEIQSASAGGSDETVVNWTNGLRPVGQHLLPVDTSLHWCYSLPGYGSRTIADDGVPIITHLHGGHTDYQFDGNPEFFYGPGGRNRVVGPQWANVPGGFTTRFRYDNDVPAGNLWYHDHALGITRLNVYAGLAGFYFVRDQYDTGLPAGRRRGGNALGLPAWPYEKAYAIQDRMFLDTGELFYPAYPGDPFYEDFIDGEGAELDELVFPDGGPTALAEFFGDHMVVTGVIWPFENVEPRNYRIRLLNGCDSRFMAIQLFEVPAGATDFSNDIQQLDFTVIGSDQGLASSRTTVDTLLFEPRSRYDIIVDFSQVTPGNRVIMKNIGGDEPFGGDIPGPVAFGETDRIMAFDVVLPLSRVPDATPTGINFGPTVPGEVDRVRKVALFEGTDEYGRLQPLLGVAEATVDMAGNVVNGALAWHQPTTENPGVGDTEIWEIYNATGDAHPVHLHLVHFQILDRQAFSYDLEEKVVPQHNGAEGTGFYLTNIQKVGPVIPIGHPAFSEYVENAPKDMVTALPGQVTRIKATFDKPGRYIWHCHILSHEDHEMMRVLHVGPGA
jgi:FtsP/CotA-like multicopper oxidase with cupredoxin domain